MRTLIFSDLHFQKSNERSDRVLGFFLEQSKVPTHFILLGDTFDVWLLTDTHWKNYYRYVLDVFKLMVSHGSRLTLFQGNHDFNFNEQYFNTLGVEVVTDDKSYNWFGKKAYLSHGDLIEVSPFSYRMMRKVLRSKTLKLLMSIFPSRLSHFLGDLWSQNSRKKKCHHVSSAGKEAQEKRVLERYRSNALRLFHRGYDIVIMGHIHLVDEHEVFVGHRRCLYISTGDGLEHFSYLAVDEGDFQLLSY